MKKREPFFWFTISCGAVILAFILIPLVEMMTSPSFSALEETIKDKDVLRSIWLSLYTAGSAALVSFLLGTPLAYILARTDFRGKRLVESIIDLPIVIPWWESRFSAWPAKTTGSDESWPIWGSGSWGV